MLTTPWVPNSTYNFKADITHGERSFLHEWFKQYDWVCYPSSKGAFIKNVFCNYKKFQEQTKAHLSSEWHKFTTLKSKNFISIMQNKTINVHQMIDNSVKLIIKNYKLKLKSIVSSIFFLGTHGLSLRGHSDDSALGI